MGKVGLEMQWRRKFVGFLGIIFQLFLLTESSESVRRQSISEKTLSNLSSSQPVKLHILDDHVVVDNGFAQITFSKPEGLITGIQYNGIRNILEDKNKESNRGYWDIVWASTEDPKNHMDLLEGTKFKVIMEDEGQVELSFTKTYVPSSNNTGPPLNVDKRYIILRDVPGFYTYAIFERLEGWRDMIIYEGRIAFKLQQELFRYMAVSDQRQRVMPTFEDREKGKPLAYPEAVLLTSTSDPDLSGEVDDKYQYSAENKDNKVHGWICSDPPTGFWMITPSNEFRVAGPHKQDLTSHAGPVTLSMFFSTHYAGKSLGLNFSEGEAWKMVFGPVFIYLNSVSSTESPLTLWHDAKKQMMIETKSWPYNFPRSEDYPNANQRGTVGGRLVVIDESTDRNITVGKSAYVGLAAPGDAGSWQTENKGYQFWVKANEDGYFLIENVRPGNYSLYAWVPGFIGDYKYEHDITITPGRRRGLGNIVYVPPRNGATLWEIGYPDRTAAEFFIPSPRPTLMNRLYAHGSADRFRQYGLWDRYTDLYPNEDLVYNADVDDYRTKWFFAHVNRFVGNKTYVPTSWKILFNLTNVDVHGNYTLRLALASATAAELQVRVNTGDINAHHFTTGLIGRDNAIARHGIHGLYRLYNVDVPGSRLQIGTNTIYLTQIRGGYPFSGVMYDYIRLEQPAVPSN